MQWVSGTPKDQGPSYRRTFYGVWNRMQLRKKYGDARLLLRDDEKGMRGFRCRRHFFRKSMRLARIRSRIRSIKVFTRASSGSCRDVNRPACLAAATIHYPSLRDPYLFLDIYVTICNKLIRTLLCYFPVACIRPRAYPSPCLVACLKWDIPYTQKIHRHI